VRGLELAQWGWEAQGYGRSQPAAEAGGPRSESLDDGGDSRRHGAAILIGEFHFGVPGRGLAAGLVQVREQAERGVAYRYYPEQAAAFPAFIGSSWSQWIDQPCTGRMVGENYNIGLVDVSNRPYLELIEAMRNTHRRIHDVHNGTIASFDTKPRARRPPAANPLKR